MGWHSTAQHGMAPRCSALQAALATSYSHNKPQPELWECCRRPQRVRSCSTAPGTPQLQPLGQRGASPARARGRGSGASDALVMSRWRPGRWCWVGSTQRGVRSQSRAGGSGGAELTPAPCVERGLQEVVEGSGTPNLTAGHHRHRDRAPLAVLGQAAAGSRGDAAGEDPAPKGDPDISPWGAQGRGTHQQPGATVSAPGAAGGRALCGGSDQQPGQGKIEFPRYFQPSSLDSSPCTRIRCNGFCREGLGTVTRGPALRLCQRGTARWGLPPGSPAPAPRPPPQHRSHHRTQKPPRSPLPYPGPAPC